jgi:hypothetical protein
MSSTLTRRARIARKPATRKPTGYVVWQGASPYDGAPIVAIVTLKTSNRKTGQMAQLWILRADIAPTAAIRAGEDSSICGPCPLRGDGTGKARACYVVVAQAPTNVFKAFRAGRYPVATPEFVANLLRGRKIRLGAYGDPAMLPIDVVKALIATVKGWTGYSHQWPTISPEWAHIVMASADTVADRRAARALGYRSFYVVPANTDIAAIPHAVECMATRTRNPLQCAECLACSGTRGRAAVAVDIVIAAHGTGARYVHA